LSTGRREAVAAAATGSRARPVVLEPAARARTAPTTAAHPTVGISTIRSVAQSATHASAVTHASSVASEPLARIDGDRHHKK